jgi:hypothetical protein
MFMVFYALDNKGKSQINRIIPYEPSPEELPEVIRSISAKFVEIYKEAIEAKDAGLKQICGPGYRKAFEFLIKDYAKEKLSDEETRQKVGRTFAGTVVEKYIADARIQSVAKRALWLGNDETHYLREWTDHDIEDLISLIRLTIHWIEIEHLSNKYVENMPEK